MLVETCLLPAHDGWARFAFPRALVGPPAASGEPEAILSLRALGDMRYLANRQGNEARRRDAFFRSLGLDPGLVLGTELHHTRRVLLVGRGESSLHGPEPLPGGEEAGATSHDGIICADGKHAASITVADCMPIWLLDRGSGAFGVLHSGWKGTGILEVALRALIDRGSKAADIALVLGPAIGPCCYTVDEGRARSFASEFGDGAAPLVDGKHRLDLRAANLDLARRLGVGAVRSVEACTSCDSRLGSFRREGAGAFTRMLALCARLPVAAALPHEDS